MCVLNIGRGLFREARWSVLQQAADQKQRVTCFAALVGQIDKETRGAWKASQFPCVGGAEVFISDFVGGDALAFLPDGRVYQGKWQSQPGTMVSIIPVPGGMLGAPNLNAPDARPL